VARVEFPPPADLTMDSARQRAVRPFGDREAGRYGDERHALQRPDGWHVHDRRAVHVHGRDDRGRVRKPPVHRLVNGASIDTPLTTAFALVPSAKGGEILIPAGAFTSSAGFPVFDDRRNITIQGMGGAGAGAQATTQITYTGTGSRIISARSTTHFKLQDVQLLYNNAGFAGDVIDFSHSAGLGTDSAYQLVERCYLGGSGVGGASSLLNLVRAISGAYRDTVFGRANYGVRGLTATVGCRSSSPAPGSSRRLVLDGLDLAQGPTGSIMLHSFSPPLFAKRKEWIEAADADGAILARDPLISVGDATITVAIPGVSRDDAQTTLGTIVDKLEEADRNPGGIPLVWTPSGGTVSGTAYVLTGEVTELPVDWESGWMSNLAMVTFTLSCKPGWYLDPVTYTGSRRPGRW
jgi:hypothetical protein